MKNSEKSYCFLTVGKVQESTEGSDFKRYVGLAGCFVKAVNPDKKQLEEITGFAPDSEPQYLVDTDNGKEARIVFYVATDPATNNGIETTQRVTFSLRREPAYNKDQTKLQVIDRYGNTTWANAEDAKNKVQLSTNMAIDQVNYRIAYSGEADLVAFLKTYLCVPSSLNYINGTWTLSENAEDGKFALEHIEDYFKGDFSEMKEALSFAPNNKIKLLFGVRTTDEGKQYQAIASREGLMLRNSTGSKALMRLETRLASIKNGGGYANTMFLVQPLTEWNPQPTDFSQPAESSVQEESSGMPWE